MAKSYSQFEGEGRKYAPKPKRKVAASGGSGSSGSSSRRGTSGHPNAIRTANQVRQDMKRHRRNVLRMGHS